MLRKTIDKLLLLHFKNKSYRNNLNYLESDIWQKINAIKSDKALPWQEKMFLSFGVPSFRFASIIIALLLGVGAGTIMPSKLDTSTSRGMGLHVFASNIEYLPSNIFLK